MTVFNFQQPYDWPLSPVLQGQSWQNGYLNQLWEIEICMQVRFVWKVLLKFWDLRNFASSTSFHKMCNLHHLWPNWQTHKKKTLEKNILNVTTVKLFSFKKFNVLCLFEKWIATPQRFWPYCILFQILRHILSHENSFVDCMTWRRKDVSLSPLRWQFFLLSYVYCKV